MTLDLLLLLTKSIVIGIIVAMPLGPICMLLIKKTLESGIAAGLAIAIGAALGDALYSGIAGFAMASVATFIAQHKLALRLVGKGVMSAVLLSEIRHWSNKQEHIELSTKGQLALCLKIFLMTLANPVTILVISSVFISMGIHFSGASEISIAIIGIFIGSTLWCSSLAYITLYAKQNLPSAYIDGIKWVSLAILASFVIFI